MNSIPQENQKKISIKNRLKELTGLLVGAFKDSSQQIPVSQSELASMLYARAPLTFLEGRSAQSLAALASEAHTLLSQFLKNQTPIIQQASASSGFFVLVTDRPFIVSSVGEAARKNNVDIEMLLHPIITLNNIRVSLNYIELSKNTPENLELFSKVLKNILPPIIAVTDSFKNIQQAVKATASKTGDAVFLNAFGSSDNQDVKQFIEWLLDDTFIFIGSAYWKVSKGVVATDASEKQGIFTVDTSDTPIISRECHEDAIRFIEFNQPLWISKLSVQSPILRTMPLTHIYLADLDGDGKLAGITSLLGIFSSKGLAAEGRSIELINQKARKLLAAESALSDSHNHKFIVDTIDRMPKEEAIRLDTASLLEIIEQTIDVYTRNDAMTTLRYDASGRGALVLVMMPRDWFGEDTRRSIQQAIADYFHLTPDSIENYLDLSAHGLARIYFHIPVTGKIDSEGGFTKLQEQIKHLSKDWSSKLESALRKENMLEKGSSAQAYTDLFSAAYQATYSVEDAISDIRIIDTLTTERSIRVHLAPAHIHNGHPQSRIDVFSLNSELTLSRVLPIFEHTGFEVLSDASCTIKDSSKGTIHIYRFSVIPRGVEVLNPDNFRECLSPGLEDIFLGLAEDDVLSSLMLTANLHSRCVLLLRTYTSHLWQLNVFQRKHQIREALAANPKIALKFWELFEYKFNPVRTWSKDERLARFAQSKREYEDLVREEKDILKDKTLRALLELVEHTVRTNFFNNDEAIAIKVHSKAVDFIPEPKPWMEVFIHSKDIEGCHLRSGPVTRGGIRWSERPDDFRTEVLGLVKTQRVKNVFIVPGGAKGGFIVRNMPSNPAEIAPTVQQTYKKYIRTLLSLPDNRVGKEIVPPKNLIIYDEQDPYFVVAADKGTATFSDTANGLASDEFHFWLDDAFASGGSNGYDHKLYGITARGAWECVLRHFNDMGLNYETTPFTMVGIGDLAGDVFGNGLIISDKAKLLAAFNHKHIFIDPTPDPEGSFKERVRVFNLGRSQWSDYNASLISKGGGLYDRASKEITLSQEARHAIGIDPSVPAVISGEELIAHILKAPVDVLWNGGIGTYVKSSGETNMQVNDSANDRVRVSAPELRCKIVGEGGNLGFTQKARIEYAKLGGRINTDAIDNSGGVGLSDNEVNIKILFSGILKSGRLTKDQRNAHLKEVALDVCESVLQHNRDHAYRLTVSSERSVIQHEYFKSFLTHLAKLGFINRELDCLPQEDELYERLSQKNGMYRPELAVCLAASKMWVKNLLSTSPILNQKECTQLLMSYFPAKLQEKFKDDILAHPLRDSIVATQATNQLVNFFGISFLYRSMLTMNLGSETALLAGLATLLLFDVPQTVLTLQKLDTPEMASVYIKMRSVFEKGLRSFAAWIMPRCQQFTTIEQILAKYAPKIEMMRKAEVFDKQVYDELISVGIPSDTAKMIALFPGITPVLEVASLSDDASIPFDTAWSFSQLAADKLRMFSLRSLVRTLKPQNRWEAAVRKSAVSDVEQAISRIVLKAVQCGVKTDADLEKYLASSPSFQPIVQSVNELTNITFGLPQLVLIARQVRDFTL